MKINKHNLLHDLIDLDITGNDLPKLIKLIQTYRPYFKKISRLLYSKLNKEDRQRFITWLLKRWGKIDIINPMEMATYLSIVNTTKNEAREEIEINGKKYTIQDLSSQGQDFKLAVYDWVLCIHDVYYNQYEHGKFRIKPGETIIDAGGFVGDTAVLFSKKSGANCKIHSFEILDENIDLFIYNNSINGIENQVIINKFALSDKTGNKVGFNSPEFQGATAVIPAQTTDNQVETITIDYYVAASGLERVDLIKMDIEGSELAALKGAYHTIRHFRPKLAICLYHKWDDIITIPEFIKKTGVAYKFNFKWVQLTDGWEAVLLAEPKNPLPRMNKK